LSLRAVVFDYGNVLTNGYDMAARQRLFALTGLAEPEFERHYWPFRNDYDLGLLSGFTFWQKFAEDAGLALSDETLHDLAVTDARMWSTANPRMTGWQQKLKAAGFRTAILSNMGDTVLEILCQTHAWIANFDEVIWSYELKLAKPDPAIYHAMLAKVGTKPEETLFIDDREENIEAARALGIKTHLFTTVEALIADLKGMGLDGELPELV